MFSLFGLRDRNPKRPLLLGLGAVVGVAAGESLRSSLGRSGLVLSGVCPRICFCGMGDCDIAESTRGEPCLDEDLGDQPKRERRLGDDAEIGVSCEGVRLWYVVYSRGRSLCTTGDGPVRLVRLGVPSRLGRRGGNALFSEGFVGGSTFRCASSGGTTTLRPVASATGCPVSPSIEDCAVKDRLEATFALAAKVFGAFVGASCLSRPVRPCAALTVEFEDDVDDSRTDGKPTWSLLEVDTSLLPNEGRDRVGLIARGCLSEVAGTPDAYDEAELGVGTWLKGESVYLVEGVPVWAWLSRGGVKFVTGLLSSMADP